MRINNNNDKQHLPANMEEWKKLEPALTSKQPDNLFIFNDPDKPKRYELEKAIRKARFFNIMVNKYKNWFANFEDFVFARHAFNDLYLEFQRKHALIRPTGNKRKSRSNKYE